MVYSSGNHGSFDESKDEGLKIKYNSVICGNSDILLKQMVGLGMTFDLILTDPPYNINKDFGNDSDKLPMSEFLSVSKERISNCSFLLSDNGSIIWFGAHHYIGFIQTIMHEQSLHYRRLNIWHYKNGFSRAKKTLATQYEPFLWFSKSDKKWVFNADDVRVPYDSQKRLKTPVYYKNSKGEKREWKPHPLGAMRGDVWCFPTLAGKNYANERTAHPTQKPESLTSSCGMR